MGTRVERLQLHAVRSTEAWTARGVITAALVLPVIYSLLLPFGLLDLWVQSYQAVCFRLLNLRRVRRRDYIVVDRTGAAVPEPDSESQLRLLRVCQWAGCVHSRGCRADRTILVSHQTQRQIADSASASASFRAVWRCRRVSLDSCPGCARSSPRRGHARRVKRPSVSRLGCLQRKDDT